MARENTSSEPLDLERKILHAQRLESLSIMAAGIAHEFNNLLTVILGNANLAALEAAPSPAVVGHLEKIEKTCLKAAELCKQLLAYSGEGHYVGQRLNLNDLVRDLKPVLHLTLRPQITLEMDLAPSLPLVQADPAHIRQVILNLLENAAESISDRPGKIKISTGCIFADRSFLNATYLSPDLPEQDYAFIRIDDDGCGIAPELQNRIFDPFFSTKFTGRGLGLPSALGIIRGHRGALKFHSVLDQGSSFEFLLPTVLQEALAPPASTELSPFGWRSAGTILVIDQEEIVRNVAAQTIERLGCIPCCEARACEGLAFLSAHPDARAILLGHRLPGFPTGPIIDGIRAINSKIPILLMSGYRDESDRLRLKEKGVDEFLRKPFTPDELVQKLRPLLDRPISM